MNKFLIFGLKSLIDTKLIERIKTFKNYSYFVIDKNELDLLFDSNKKLIINKLINNKFKGIIVCLSLV